jgi:hypothetical protein
VHAAMLGPLAALVVPMGQVIATALAVYVPSTASA